MNPWGAVVARGFRACVDSFLAFKLTLPRERARGGRASRGDFVRVGFGLTLRHDEIDAGGGIVLEDEMRVEEIVGLNLLNRGFHRWHDSAIHQAALHSGHCELDVASNEDLEIKQVFEPPRAQQQIVPLDQDRCVVPSHVDGVGLGVFLRVIKGRKTPRVISPQGLEVGSQLPLIKGVRSAATSHVGGRQFTPRHMVTVHRQDPSRRQTLSKRCTQCRLAASGSPNNGYQVHIISGPERFQDKLYLRFEVQR
mgnify:CR=1 FL=1